MLDSGILLPLTERTRAAWDSASPGLEDVRAANHRVGLALQVLAFRAGLGFRLPKSDPNL